MRSCIYILIKSIGVMDDMGSLKLSGTILGSG